MVRGKGRGRKGVGGRGSKVEGTGREGKGGVGKGGAPLPEQKLPLPHRSQARSTSQMQPDCFGYCSVIAKFHYTGPTGPDQTRVSADFVWSGPVRPVGPV